APTTPSARKLVVIDGHSLAYRAFYGLPLYDRRGKVSFSTASGELTNAVYGFANMLIKTWTDERPDYIAVAFDAGRTFRDDLFEPYKGTRDKMPDELAPQIERIVELVRAFGIPAITAEGYEADDILGTLATRAAADGIDVLIVTGDTDAFQLIGPHVRVLAPGRLWSDVAVWDADGIARRYGLTPAQLIDFKALKGDTSDNIPGVKGIGGKTAVALLEKFASIEDIFEKLERVEKMAVRGAAGIRAKLEQGREHAFLSKDLATISTKAPVKASLRALQYHGADRQQVEALFDQLGFGRIRERIPRWKDGGNQK
ncbi:DNA polymerase I, partial [candidate division KSB1 bacterium]|nr:DNA polymerase I [candidate division KSB1 bacterium]